MGEDRTMSRVLRCYAEGRDGAWEGFCLDLDIAVQGDSFEGVFQSLNDAVSLYFESVAALPENERSRLLNRPVPLWVKLRFLAHVLHSTFRDRDRGDHWHQFTMPSTA